MMAKGAGAAGGSRNAGGAGGRSAGSGLAKVAAGAAAVAALAAAATHFSAGSVMRRNFAEWTKEAAAAGADVSSTKFGKFMGVGLMGPGATMRVFQSGNRLVVDMSSADGKTKMQRSFDLAKKTAHHETFMLSGDKHGSGLGSKWIRHQMEGYKKLGIQQVKLDASYAGRYVWPSVGFRASAKDEARLAASFRDWAKSRGHSVSHSVKSAPDVANYAVAGKKLGKEFLLSDASPRMSYSATPDAVLSGLRRKGR